MNTPRFISHLPHTRWGDLSDQEQDYIIRYSTKSPVNFCDLQKPFMPAHLCIGRCKIECFYCAMNNEDINICIDMDATFVPLVKPIKLPTA